MINYFQNDFGLRMSLNYVNRNHSGIKESQGTMANTHTLEGQAVPQSACSQIGVPFTPLEHFLICRRRVSVTPVLSSAALWFSPLSTKMSLVVNLTL